MTHECLSGHVPFTSGLSSEDSVAVVWPNDLLLALFSDSLESAPLFWTKSKAVPGVLGVLVAEPKDAKAPDPRPNADDAPGDVMVLAPFDPLDRAGLAVSMPGNRLELEKVRLELSGF